MEQGPVLESRGYAVGPVAAIAGQTRLSVSVEGTQVSLCFMRHVSTPISVIGNLITTCLVECCHALWPALAQTAVSKLTRKRICRWAVAAVRLCSSCECACRGTQGRCP